VGEKLSELINSSHIMDWSSDWHLKWLMDISVMDAQLRSEDMFLLI